MTHWQKTGVTVLYLALASPNPDDAIDFAIPVLTQNKRGEFKPTHLNTF